MRVRSRGTLVLRLGAVGVALAWAWSAEAVAPRTADDPHAGLPIGAPQFEYAWDGSWQASRADDPRLAALGQRWGGGWRWRFDPATGRPIWATLAGVPEHRAAALLEDLRQTLGPAELVPVSDREQGGLRAIVAEQRHDGLPMYGTELALFAVKGRVVAVRAHLASPPAARAPRGATLWWPLALGERGGKGWVGARRVDVDDVTHIVAVGGEVLARWSNRHPATVEVEVEPRKVGDTRVVVPLARVTVTDGAGASTTDAAGSHAAADPYAIEMAGDRLRMRDAFRSGAPTPAWSALSGNVKLVFSGGTPVIDPASADTWVHTTDTQDWLEALVPDHALLDVQVVATVNRSDVRCNAYYTSATVNFARPSGSCANTGRLADVIMHELGHGIHHYGLLAGGFAGDLSEGTADYVAATQLDDPRIGLGFFGGTSILRDIDPDRVYPRDFRGQVHNDGLIWASFLWNLRDDWQQAYGDEAGAAMADLLMLRAMATGPAMTTVGDAAILADDDDGDLANGTPHGCAILDLLRQHGLGPGPIGVIAFEHAPRDDAGSYEESYPVDFAVYDATPGCSGLDRSSVALWWTIDAVTAEDAGDTFDLPEPEPLDPDTDADTDGAPEPEPVRSFVSAGGARWTRLEVTEDGSFYAGDIPRQVATSRVTYFVEARSVDGAERVTTHQGHLDRMYTFRVGDRERVWCEGFEGDAPGWESGVGTPWEAGRPDQVDEWTLGPPGKTLWEPTAAYEGTRVAGTAIGRTYRNLNTQHMRSPAISVPSEGRMLSLAYQRWLTVEDALYDKAQIYLNDDQVWQQPGTGDGADHTLDRRWRLHEFDVSHLAGEEARLTWVLRSDPGLEYGGWRLDDVCLVRLADIPGHHRIRDLSAVRTEGGIALSWTHPWIGPLDEVVVVRGRNRAPTGRIDGVQVWRAGPVEPGAEVSFVDTEVDPCATWSYLALVRGDGVWYEAVVEGENLASAATECGEIPPDELPDPVADIAARPGGEVAAWQMPETWSCGGCQGGAGVLSTFGALLGLALVRRRRVR